MKMSKSFKQELRNVVCDARGNILHVNSAVDSLEYDKKQYKDNPDIENRRRLIISCGIVEERLKDFKTTNDIIRIIINVIDDGDVKDALLDIHNELEDVMSFIEFASKTLNTLLGSAIHTDYWVNTTAAFTRSCADITITMKSLLCQIENLYTDHKQED